MEISSALFAIAIFALLRQGDCYSKYGRTCKDIGCLSSEICVMDSDPCSYYQREDKKECGSYPTCKKVSSNSAPSCANYICPPTKVCHLDGDTPKCVDDVRNGAPDGRQQVSGSYPSYNIPDPNAPNAPSYPNSGGYPGYPSSGGGLYPNVQPNGHTTTTRSPLYRPSGNNGGGYQGGSVGSGYPGQVTYNNNGQRYPSQGYPGQGYPNQGGYPGQGYPGQGGYPGYPAQGGGGNRYPSQGYPGQGYPSQGGYQNGGYRGGYPNNYYQSGQQRYGQKSGSDSSKLLDSITNKLKSIGLFCLLVNYLTSRLFTPRQLL